MDNELTLKRPINVVDGGRIVKDSGYIDRRLSYLIIIFYYIKVLNLAMKTIFPIPRALYPQVSFMFGIVYAIYFFLTIPKVLKRTPYGFIFIELIFAMLFIISYFMGNAEHSLLMENAFWMAGFCIPLSVYMYSIKDKKIFYNLFLKYSLIITIVLLLTVLYPFKDSEYSMSFSSALVIPTLFHITEWFKNRKMLYLSVAIIEIIGIVLYGSRGALIAITFLIVLRYIFDEKSMVKKIGIGLIISIVFLAIYTNFDRIGVMIIEFLAKKGYHSRTLRLLFSGNITYDSGRSDFFKYYLDLVSQKPVLGWGLSGGVIRKGWGTHNMLIEFMLAFGVIFGNIINFTLALLQFRVFSVKDDDNIRDLLAIYTSTCISLFFVSSGILQRPNFFIFLSLIIASFKQKPVSKLNL